MHLYQHYKGGWYLTLTENGTEESTGKRVVAYFSPWKLKLWIRYPENFFSTVDIGDSANPQVPRFRKVL